MLHLDAAELADQESASSDAPAPEVAGTDRVAPDRAVARVWDDRHQLTGMHRPTRRRLACDAGLVLVARGGDGAPLDVDRRTRRATAPLRRAAAARDDSCSFPGCGAIWHLHAHHARH